MDNMIPLSPEEMEEVSGGATVTVRIRNVDVRSGPGTGYPVIATVSSGVTVNTLGHISRENEDGSIWYLINKPANGWINAADLGI